MEIKEILGISELYEFHKKLSSLFFDEDEKEKYFDKILSSGIDISTDFIRDLYQVEASQRKSLKQDYTPDSLCSLFYALSSNPDMVLDECSGTGSLAIKFIANGAKKIICIETSETVLPLLLFNMSIRNIEGYVIKEDITTQAISTIYELKPGHKYSSISISENILQFKASTIISNPPYSLPWNGIADERTEGYPIPPKSKADYLFVLDIMARLDDEGEAFVLLPHGVLFRGSTEGEIRKKLIQEGKLKAIIGLPNKMFLNTDIPTVMLCLSHKKSNGIYVMDATSYATKNSKTNTLTPEAVAEIAENYKQQKDIEKIARLVSLQEIEKNDFNLNIPRYIDTYEPEELPDIKELVSGILKIDDEIRETEKALSEMMGELVGENYQNDIGELRKLWS